MGSGIPRPTRLSPRQKQVLFGLLTGSSEKQIARSLNISVHTVHCHVKAVYRLYDVAARCELMTRLISPTMLQAILNRAEDRLSRPAPRTRQRPPGPHTTRSWGDTMNWANIIGKITGAIDQHLQDRNAAWAGVNPN